MPQLTASMNISPRQDGSPRTEPQPPSLAATAPGRSSSSRPGRSTSQSRDIFPKARFPPPQAGPPAFTFIIGGRQMGRRCQGRRFQTSFTPTPPLNSLPPRAYAHKLPVIGRVSKPVRRWTCSHYSLHLPL
ncbi:TAF6-like RNA polymerase II p300/CBP-associated factor-associated factor 65 kDa subunit 6L isoform X2 [Pimephales promelas]|uniref:TAF6-like RNA polymerase II p300/CBP-associated factor-associated factor 65 kDa subunit 6L isoform X2 n=1 Tax=Pimephales promelas TaxID=90988 RepID=UPI001955CD21|nr:TAF6-like RNA polymerase II p300/CBP-associated factor-associated factor 65 kDa subunit 6L isoform X2 [Pimephales promelas]